MSERAGTWKDALGVGGTVYFEMLMQNYESRAGTLEDNAEGLVGGFLT